ncbi:MAG: hypothetical protein QXV37_01295, partial [Candidatus Jordarchaeaceae archaeon]
MERPYKIATLGAIISIIALIMVIVTFALSAINGAFRIDHRFLGIAWASLLQLDLPIIGKIPTLPAEALYLMALTDISAKSSLFLFFNLASITAISFAIGGIMTGYGFYVFYKQNQKLMSLISAILLVVGSGLIAIIIPLGTFPQTKISPWAYLFYYQFSQIIPLMEFGAGWGLYVSIVASLAIIFVVYVLLGTTMIVIRESTPKPDLMLSAGILIIIGGLTFAGILGIILVCVA